MPKNKLNLDQLMNNLNQVGLNVINFDKHFQEQFFNKKENEEEDYIESEDPHIPDVEDDEFSFKDQEE